MRILDDVRRAWWKMVHLVYRFQSDLFSIELDDDLYWRSLHRGWPDLLEKHDNRELAVRLGIVKGWILRRDERHIWAEGIDGSRILIAQEKLERVLWAEALRKVKQLDALR